MDGMQLEKGLKRLAATCAAAVVVLLALAGALGYWLGVPT